VSTRGRIGVKGFRGLRGLRGRPNRRAKNILQLQFEMFSLWGSGETVTGGRNKIYMQSRNKMKIRRKMEIHRETS